MKPGLLVLGLCFCSSVAAAPVSSQQSLAVDYDVWFQQQVINDKIIGAAFAVVSQQGIIKIGTAGYTNTNKKQLINPDTVFRIASVSKTFAAELAGTMVQDGLLSWDDPVTRYVPDFKINGDTNKILIRDLLGQSTGLIPHAYDNLIEDGVSAADIQSKLKELSFICVPGECYSYQNSVFSLIGPVVENVSGASYANLIDQRIFKPLKMNTASVGFDAFMANKNRAEPHVKRKGQWKTVNVLPNYYRVAPAAGINASIVDMGKWTMAQLGANPLVVSSELLSVVSAPRVRTPRELYRKQWSQIVEDAHYGLGWRVYKIGTDNVIYHSGWVSGYRADVAWSAKQNLGIAVLMNAESSSINTMTATFWEMVLASSAPTQSTTSP